MGGPNKPEKRMFLAIPVPEAAFQHHVESLKRTYPDYQITFQSTPLKNPTAEEGVWVDVEILVTYNLLPSSPALCPRLKLIHFISAGIDSHTSHPLITSTTIPVTTSTGVHGPAMAEWFIATLLSHTVRLPELYTWRQRREWGNPLSFFTRRTLQGRCLGILGYGGIGRQAARLATAMGMDVIAFTASAKDTPESRRLTTYTIPGTGDVDGKLPSAWFSGSDKKALHNFLSQGIDILLIALPLSDKTRHLIGKEEFEVLAAHSPSGPSGGPFISNLARGDIVVQSDLIAALNGGKVQAAALDVADPEPLSAESELWDAKNCLITPHMSGINAEYFRHVLEILRINLRREEEGGKMVNELKRGRGY